MTKETEKMYIEHCEKVGARIENDPDKPGMFLWMPAPANEIASFGFNIEDCLMMAKMYLTHDFGMTPAQREAVVKVVSVCE